MRFKLCLERSTRRWLHDPGTFSFVTVNGWVVVFLLLLLIMCTCFTGVWTRGLYIYIIFINPVSFRKKQIQLYLSVVHLKLQSVSFVSLSPSLFENLELQLLVELSLLCVLCSGTAPARMNLMFWGKCVSVSHCTGVDIYCTSQSQILDYVLEYIWHK